MSGAAARRAADLLLALLKLIASRGLRMWVEAIRAEAEHLPDRDALRFVAASVPGLLATFARAATTVTPGDVHAAPRRLAALAATGAVGLGGAHMIAAGAPAAMLLVNGMALALGLLGLAATRRLRPLAREGDEIAMIAIATALLATSLLGVAVHGAARWFAIGPLMIQPSLILLPLLLMIFARTLTATGSLAVAIAALAIALQPDRAMAGVLVAGLAALWTVRRDRLVTLALAASAAGLCVTLARTDGLPAAPYSDGIFSTSWHVHPLLGLAVWLGAALLLLPCAIRGAGEAGDEARRAVFGATWFSISVAAMVGNYPAPLVGYGGSAILGYLLAASLLPNGPERRKGGAAGQQPRERGSAEINPIFPSSVSCA